MGFIDKAGKFVLNRVFGVMTSRQCTASALKAGRRLITATQSGQPLSSEMLGSIFTQSLPRGVNAPPIMTSADALRTMCGSALPTSIGKKIGNKVAEASIKNGLAACVSVGKKSGLYLPEHLLKDPELYVVGATHEFTHFLDFKKKASLGRFFMAFVPMPAKALVALPLMKYLKPSMEIQGRILADLGIPSACKGAAAENLSKILNMSKKKMVKYLRKHLKNFMTEKGFGKFDRKVFLHYLNCIISMEKSAYLNGGKIGHSYLQLGQNGEHISEIFATINERLLDAIKAEKIALKKAKRAGIKKFSTPKVKFCRLRIGHKIEYARRIQKTPHNKPAALRAVESKIKEQVDTWSDVFEDIQNERSAALFSAAACAEGKAATKIISEETIKL